MSAAVLPLCAAHIAPITTLLSDAFVDDVGMRTLCAGTREAQYRQCLAAWFQATLHLHLARQQPAWVVIVEGMVVGAALLTRAPAPVVLPAWLRWFGAVGTHCGWGVVWRTAHHERQRACYRPTQAHAVLEFIAIHGDYRGQGYATLLFDTLHQWSKTQTLGIWLETTRLPNVSFFEHFGYMVTGSMPLEQGEALFLFRARD